MVVATWAHNRNYDVDKNLDCRHKNIRMYKGMILQFSRQHHRFTSSFFRHATHTPTSIYIALHEHEQLQHTGTDMVPIATTWHNADTHSGKHTVKGTEMKAQSGTKRHSMKNNRIRLEHTRADPWPTDVAHVSTAAPRCCL